MSVDHADVLQAMLRVARSISLLITYACRLLQLLHPAGSVMDLNIGAALWLAARGIGQLHSPSAAAERIDAGKPADNCNLCKQAVGVASAGVLHGAACTEQQQTVLGTASAAQLPKPECTDTATFCSRARAPVHGVLSNNKYTSRARVVLVGHGADEVFAGYGRHRTAFKHGGYQGLQAELEKDMQRLWLRNLGRDDRLIADWSREARHPFLDENLLRAAASISIEGIVDPTMPLGQGDKMALRAVARQLGLPRAAARAKRAIQFGSRIGRTSNVRDYGSNRKANRAKAGSAAVPVRPAD